MPADLHNHGCVSSDVDLLSALSLAGAAVDRHVLDELHARGFAELRPRHGYVVQRLLVAPQTATELAAALGVTQQAVSKLAGELLAAGYVQRTDDERDARRRPLALTERGEEAVAAARAARADLESRVA